MRPRTINHICAHPIAVSWTVGAAVVNAAVIGSIAEVASSPQSLLRWDIILLLAFALVPGTLLGLFLGLFACSPIVIFVCRRLNGAPYVVGDKVLVLTGPHRGAVATVYGITTGQGGEPLLRLDLGPRQEPNHRELFEDVSVLRIREGEPGGGG